MREAKKVIKTSLIGFLLVFPIGCSEKKVPTSDIPLESIIIDIDDHKEKTHGSLLIDTTNFEIIPLETNDSCLVSEITKMQREVIK